MSDPVPVAEKIVLALQGAPMLLTLLVINCAILGMVTFLVSKSADLRTVERHELVDALKGCIQRCAPLDEKGR